MGEQQLNGDRGEADKLGAAAESDATGEQQLKQMQSGSKVDAIREQSAEVRFCQTSAESCPALDCSCRQMRRQ